MFLHLHKGAIDASMNNSIEHGIISHILFHNFYFDMNKQQSRPVSCSLHSQAHNTLSCRKGGGTDHP